jgi:hypothetical protein
MARTLTLFESATQRGRVVKQGDLVQIIVDGGGAMVVAMQDFVMAQKWAQSKPASGNAITDRGRFLEQFPVLVSRPGSFVGTRGNERQLQTFTKKMRAAGYDLAEWMLPPELKNPLTPEEEKKAEDEARAKAKAARDARNGVADDTVPD